MWFLDLNHGARGGRRCDGLLYYRRSQLPRKNVCAWWKRKGAPRPGAACGRLGVVTERGRDRSHLTAVVRDLEDGRMLVSVADFFLFSVCTRVAVRTCR